MVNNYCYGLMTSSSRNLRGGGGGRAGTRNRRLTLHGLMRNAMAAQICHILAMILCIISITTLRSSAIDCVCPEDQRVYECSVPGGVATVWRGSAFDCGLASNSIILRHSNPNSVGTCNNGHLVAESIETFNGTFTSQLNVTVSEDLHNKTIECAIEYGNGTVSAINMTTIIVIGKYYCYNSRVQHAGFILNQIPILLSIKSILFKIT